MEAETATKASFFENWSKKWQYLLDKSSPHVAFRWVGFVTVFALYFLRVYFLNGWFIVTYGLGIYLLNQLIGFLSPQVRNYVPTLLAFTSLHFYGLGIYLLNQLIGFLSPQVMTSQH